MFIKIINVLLRGMALFDAGIAGVYPSSDWKYCDPCTEC